MLGSKKRDYKTEDRRVREALNKYDNRTEELKKLGLSEEESRKQAFREQTGYNL